MKQTYDTILVLTGETSRGDETTFPVSRVALKAYEQGIAGSIFISGGYHAFNDVTPRQTPTEAHITRQFFLERGVPEQNVYIDPRPLETVGNFSYLVADPLRQNPNVAEMKSIYLPVREGRENRVRDSARMSDLAGKLVIRTVKDDYQLLPDGTKIPAEQYEDSQATQFYHTMLMRTLNRLNPQTPSTVHDFLINHHPFYQKDWFKKSPQRRKMETALTVATWPFRSFK